MFNFLNKIPWQFKLVTLMLLMAILPSLVISYGITGLIRDELKSSINDELLFSANSIASNISSKIKSSIEPLELIQKTVENRELGPDQKIAFMVSSIDKLDNLLSLKLIVMDGNSYSEALSTEKETRKVNGRIVSISNSLEKDTLANYLNEAKSFPYISTPKFNRSLSAWLCRVILKVDSPNLHEAYLTAVLDLNDIENEIDNHLLNKIGVLFTADSTGNKFLSSKISADLPSKIIDDAKTLLKNGSRVVLVNNYEDKEYGNFVSCFAYPGNVNWIVVASIRENAAYATVHDAYIFFLIFAGISALLSIIIAMLFSRHISRPIINMSKVSKAIASGNFEANVDYQAGDSIGLLSSSLSKMGSQLKHDFYEIESQKRQLEDYSKNLEKKVELRTNELSESNKELKKAYQRVLELNDEKNEFLEIAAHDLKNPLIAISSFAELIKDDKDLLPEQRNEFLDEIAKASNRMFIIVKNLLDVNAIEQGKLDIKNEKVSIKSVISELISQMQNEIAKKNLNLIEKYECGPCEISGDHNVTLQIIQNILSNAVKFSPSGKNIFITVKNSADDKYVEIRVKDEGPGFTEDDRKKLFQKFSRLSARPTGGEFSTGLGLSIVKKMIEIVNGKIELESESGAGAEFILSFPKPGAE